MKKILLLSIAIMLFIALHAQQTEIYHRVKVNTGTDGLLNMAKAGIAVDHGIVKKGVYFITDLSEQELSTVNKLGLTYSVLINDVSKHYQERNKKKSAEKTSSGGCSTCTDPSVPNNFTLGSMGGFYTYAEFLSILDQMRTLYPNLITVKQAIGSNNTVEGRPVYYVKISENADVSSSRPQVLYTSLHHAREPESLSQLIFFMWYLLENYNANNEVAYLLDHTELYFIPCINPDGYAYNQTTNPTGGGMWRKNRNSYAAGDYGVDLNRNYGAFFGYDNTGSSPSHSADTYRGPSAFSEVETQAVRDFCNAHQFQIALNAHTFSNLLIYPYGHIASLETPDSTTFRTLAKDMVKCSGFAYGTPSQTVGYTGNGSSEDWMYEEQTTKPKTFALTPEAGDLTDGFWPASNRIIPIAKQTMDQNLDVSRLVHAYATISNHDDKAFYNSINSWVHFDFKRIGLDNGSFNITMIPLSANINSVGPPKNYNNTQIGVDLSDSFSVSFVPSITIGSTIRYVLQWQNQDGFSKTDTFSAFYIPGDTAFFSDCNSISSFTTSSGWAVTNADFVSPGGSITESPNGNYPGQANLTITTTNSIDLTKATIALLSYKAKWFVERGYDHVQVQVAGNNQVFQPLCGKYTHGGSANQGSAIAVYDGDQPNWVAEQINISEYAGQNIKVRFVIQSDALTESDGFYFDDLLVLADSSSFTPVNEISSKEFYAYTANPASDNVTLYYSLPEGTRSAQVIMTDYLGRIVQTMAIDTKRNDCLLSLNSLASGTYFYRIVTNNRMSATRKLLVVN